ncbi:MAG: DUF934 domain-containing protein [Hydrogenophaga sp.]
MTHSLQLFPAGHFDDSANSPVTLAIANDADPREADLNGIQTVLLNFPTFSDGRAFSQAFLLRRRLGFTGEIRATGDVLVDQLQQMQRSGFSQAVLRADQDISLGQELLKLYAAFYQGDAVATQPRFSNATV